MRVNLQARAATAEQRRARTRERLLDAAERVIGERGIEGVSIDAFVAAAGVSRGTFYNYFPTVTDLLHAMNGRLAEDLDRRVAGLTGPIEDCAIRLAAFIHVVMASSLVDPVSGWVGLQVAGANPPPRQHVFEDRFDDLYREGVACGRFRPADLPAARTLVFGAVRMARRDVLSGVALRAQGVPLVALILTAFGVAFEEAEQISREEAEAALQNSHPA
jgi:AcrR family transcriptional regulator